VVQDIEFTVQEGKLFMLQCRGGKRTGMAAVRIAVEMVAEGLVDPAGAVLMVEPTHLDQLLHPQFQDEAAYQPDVVGKGLPASPGAAVGQVRGWPNLRAACRVGGGGAHESSTVRHEYHTSATCLLSHACMHGLSCCL
jgi:hypothetical protein